MPNTRCSNETAEPPMTPPRRSHTRQQTARRRRLRKERERLQHAQARAQRALRAVEQALQELGLPETVAKDVQWRLQAQQKRLGTSFGMMYPPFLAAGATVSGVGYAGGTSTCPAASWARGRSRSGSGAGNAWARTCWYGCGGRSRTNVRPPAVGGTGPGWVTTSVCKKYGQQLGLVGTG